MPPKFPFPTKVVFPSAKLDEFIDKRINKLPKDLPEPIKQKLLLDAKFLSEFGDKTQDPSSPEPGAIKGISKRKKEKKAYPNFDSYMYIQPSRDVKKWVQAVRDFYYRVHTGQASSEALKNVTSGWDTMEKLDFESWLRFYQEGAHKKYKTAQVNYWEDANRAGYFVPIFPERPQPEAPMFSQKEIDNARDPATNPDVNAAEKREVIEKQRGKIIGRLDSAEKLLRSHEGQMFAEKEFEQLLEAIYDLKKKIHMVNKKSSSTRLYEDMIVREANVLTRKGFVKAASLLNSIAQAIPNPAEAGNPVGNGGLPGVPFMNAGPGLAPEGAGLSDSSAPADPSAEAAPPPQAQPTANFAPPPSPPGIEAGKNPGQVPDTTPAPPAQEPLAEGMQEFLDGLDTGNDSFEKTDEVLEVYDTDDLKVTAQAIAPDPVIPPAPDAPLEVGEDQVPANAEPSKDFDNMLNSAFSGITVEDVVSKLEEVAKIFKVREIPRQLALVDLMLNQLDLAAMFPTLGEAINKSLESNQYISTRIDDILSRLRGTLKTPGLDLTGKKQEASPEAQQVKQQLTDENEQEKARKKMKKDQENQELNPGKTTPEIDLAGEMAGQPPAPAAPLPPPPASPVR